MSTDEGLVIGDIIVWEANENFCREDLTVLASNTFVIGQVGCIDADGKVNTVANAQDDVYTIAEPVTVDGGAFALRYRGQETALLAWNVSAADMQVALRAMHADLDACVVASTVPGVDYTITITHEKSCGNFPLEIGADDTLDGAVDLGGVVITHSTLGEQAGVICLEAITSASDGIRSFLVRDAIVDAANLTNGSADIYNRLAEPKVADDLELQAGYGRILVRTGPTYTELPVT